MPDYLDPPVHEVILDVKFQHDLSEEAVMGIPQVLGEPCERIAFNQIEFAPDGSTRISGDNFAHWQSEALDTCKWITRVSESQITLNSVRPGPWPTGTYVGWPAILDRWAALVSRLQGTFLAPIRRCGLRYVNKLALPANTDLDEWLSIGLHAPSVLKGITNFQLRQSWKAVDGFEDLSVNLTLALLPPEQTPRPSAIAVVLDIDIFNFLVANSPQIANIRAWYERAHAAENAVFESSITDRLRASLRHQAGCEAS